MVESYNLKKFTAFFCDCSFGLAGFLGYHHSNSVIMTDNIPYKIINGCSGNTVPWVPVFKSKYAKRYLFYGTF